jgi:hypothetical protein
LRKVSFLSSCHLSGKVLTETRSVDKMAVCHLFVENAGPQFLTASNRAAQIAR